MELLSAPSLHRYIGGPPTPVELRDRFARLVAGSLDPTVRWCNWVMRLHTDGRAVGWLQATLFDGADPCAELAWVVGEQWQGQGLATEAARWLVAEVTRLGARQAVASIAPENTASALVAGRIGMVPGDVQHDVEMR